MQVNIKNVVVVNLTVSEMLVLVFQNILGVSSTGVVGKMK